MSNNDLSIIQSDAGLVADVRGMIVETHKGFARTVNAEMTLQSWRIGKRIQVGVLQNDGIEYGQKIFGTLSQELTSREAIDAGHR